MLIRKYPISLITLLVLRLSAGAQCPEVSPLVDIHVCEGGIVTLAPLIEGNFKKVDWEGGKGTFDRSIPGQIDYTLAAEETEGKLVLTLTAIPELSSCPVVHRSVTLTIDQQPQAEVQDIRQCEGLPVLMAPKITTRYDSLLWTTSGTGSFERPVYATTAYLPSEKDVQSDGTLLTLTVKNGICPAAERTLRLILDEQPDLALTFVKKDKAFQLQAQTSGNTKLEWKTDGKGRLTEEGVTAQYEPAGQDGAVKVTVTAKGENGCMTVKELILDNTVK